MEREKMKSVDGLVVFAPVIAKILVPEKLWKKTKKNSSEGKGCPDPPGPPTGRI